MALVKKHNGAGIVEDLRRLFEPDAVLLAVPSILLLVPLELNHVYIISRYYLYCNSQLLGLLFKLSSGGPADFLDVTNYDELLANLFHPDLIVPGDSQRSKILESLSPGPDGERPRMPKNDLPLSAEELAVIRAWIDAGAPKPSTP